MKDLTYDQFDAIIKETYYLCSGQEQRLTCISEIPREVKSAVKQHYRKIEESIHSKGSLFYGAD